MRQTCWSECRALSKGSGTAELPKFTSIVMAPISNSTVRDWWVVNLAGTLGRPNWQD
jgi:hypothetical protein